MASTSNRKSEILIVCNSQQAQQALQQMKDRAKEVRTEMNQLAQAGQTMSARYMELDREMKNLSKSINYNESNMKRMTNVLNDLAHSSLRQVTQAMRDAKKAMLGMDESNPQLVEMQQNYRRLVEQAKLLKGETENIRAGMRQLSQQTDAWVSSAVTKQQQLVDATKRGTNEYMEQAAILRRLKLEEANRTKAAITTAGENTLRRNISNANEQQLQQNRANLLAYRSILPPGETEKLQEVNTMLAAIKQHEDAIHMSGVKIGEDMAVIEAKAKTLPLEIQKIDFDKASPNELKAKLDEVNALLGKIGTKSPLRNDLTNQAQRLQSALSGVNKETVNIDHVLKNLKTQPLVKLERAAEQLEADMRRLNRTTQEYADKEKALARVRAEIRGTKGEVDRLASSFWSTVKSFAKMGIVGYVQTMLVGVFNKVKDLNAEFSDALTNIRKVSGLAVSDINTLADRLAKIDTRTTIEELNQIAYAGAKLGMGKYGVAGLEGFVRAANQVNVALKEDMGEEALTQLSKITEVMGLIPQMGVEKAMLATGSALFKLGASSTANAGQIVEFSKRLMGLADVSGITTDQLLALGSASDAMALMPEVSATAFNKVFTSLGKNFSGIEKAIKVEPNTLKDLMEAGKTMDAIVLVLDKMKGMNATERAAALTALGSDGARLNAVLTTMADKVSILKTHLKRSEEAFRDATAVTIEYNMQQETAQALFERAANVWEKAFVNPEGVDNVRGLAKAWYDLSQQLTHSITFMSSVKLLLFFIGLSVKALIALLPTLITFMMFRGIIGSLSLIHTAYVNIKNAIQAATAAQLALNAAQKANLWAALLTVIATAVTAIISYKNATNEAAEAQKKLNNYISEGYLQYEKEKKELDALISKLEDANTSTQDRKDLIDQFNEDYSDYIDSLGVEIDTVDDLKEAYEDLNAEMRKKIFYQIKEKAKGDLLDDAGKQLGSALQEYNTYVQSGTSPSFDGEHHGTAWLMKMVEAGKARHVITDAAAREKYGDKAIVYGSGPNGITQTKVLRPGVERLTNPMTGENINKKEDFVEGDAKIGGLIDNVIAAWKKFDEMNTSLDQSFDGLIGDYDPSKHRRHRKPKVGDGGDDDSNKIEQEMREEYRKKEDEARAIMDNVKNFYLRQINETVKKATAEEWDKAVLDTQVNLLRNRMDAATALARQGVSGVFEDWEQFKKLWNDLQKQMELDMREGIDPTTGINQSAMLRDAIGKVNIPELRETLVNLGGKLGMDKNAVTASIHKNATLDEGRALTRAQKERQAREKAKLDDDYVGTVNNQYKQRLEGEMGYFSFTPEQESVLLGDEAGAKKLLADRERDIKQLFSNVQSNILTLYSLDPTKGENEGLIKKAIIGNMKEDTSELKDIFNLTGEELQVFYSQMLKYYDDYVEAEKKKHDRKEKLANFQWEASPEYTAQQKQATDIDIASKGVSQYLSPERPDAEKMPYKDQYGTKHFMSSMGADPEVEAYRLKIEAAREYYNFLEAHNADAQTLRDQEKAILDAQIAYAQQVASQIKQRISDVYALAAPVEDFGTSIGEAFATMTEDAEEGRKAMRKAIGDMINGFMKQTVEMTKEYMKRRIMQKMNDRLVQVQMKKQAKVETGLEDKKQDQLLETQELGGKAKEMLTKEVGGKVQDATQQIGQETLQMQQTQTQQEVQTESAKTQANTTMGIASGAAKIIGSLGWWGIPLIAVITALLNGLLSFAMSKVSSLFGGGKDSGGDSGPSTKLVSGMLTYDSGNVQAFRGIEDGKTYPVVGSDGKVYAAKDGGELSTGLVEDPITTLVNGQPALVAEKGPEMIIGRETTAAMMMARPDILAEIVKFDRQRSGRTYRAYDAGNVADFAAVAADPVGGPDLERLNATMDALAIVLAKIQQNGIRAHLNKFGRGGLVNEAENGRNFMQHNSGDRLWNK